MLGVMAPMMGTPAPEASAFDQGVRLPGQVTSELLVSRHLPDEDEAC